MSEELGSMNDVELHEAPSTFANQVDIDQEADTCDSSDLSNT